MPKTKLKFDTTTKTLTGIPTNLEALAANGEVEIWFGTDEAAVAAELNPALEKNRNDLLIEKTNIKDQYDALVGTKGATDVEVATYKAEVERLKATTIPAEDVAVLQAVKTVFPNMSATDLAKQIPQFKDATEKVVAYEKEKQQAAVFGSLGYKNAEVFKTLVQIPDMLKGVEGDIFVEPVTVQGKTEPVQTAFVNVKNAQGALEKKTWTDYTTTVNPVWKNHLPSLNFVEEDQKKENQTWMPQGTERQGEGASPLGSFLDAKNKKSAEAPNPFKPQKPDLSASTVNQN